MKINREKDDVGTVLAGEILDKCESDYPTLSLNSAAGLIAAINGNSFLRDLSAALPVTEWSTLEYGTGPLKKLKLP